MTRPSSSPNPDPARVIIFPGAPAHACGYTSTIIGLSALHSPSTHKPERQSAFIRHAPLLAHTPPSSASTSPSSNTPLLQDAPCTLNTCSVDVGLLSISKPETVIVY